MIDEAEEGAVPQSRSIHLPAPLAATEVRQADAASKAQARGQAEPAAIAAAGQAEAVEPATAGQADQAAAEAATDLAAAEEVTRPPARPDIEALQRAVQSEPNAAWATERCCARYLKARNGDLAKATAMLKATLAWRHSFGVAQLAGHRETIRRESATGKARVSDCTDREGRPVLVLTPANENSKVHDDQLINLTYHLERATGERRLRAGPPRGQGGVGKILCVMDFHHYSLRNAPKWKTSRATLSILQNHYPERLHRFLLFNAPSLFYAFFRAISPFIDPVTKEKIVFVPSGAEARRACLEATFRLEEWEEGLGGARPRASWDAAYLDKYLGDDAEIAEASRDDAAPN